eukprot:6214772-Pleurochrysis_carterae.AAC.8
MFLSFHARNGDGTLVTLILRAQAHACTFDMNARYGGAGQREAWPLSRGRARTYGAAVRPCRPHQMLYRS